MAERIYLDADSCNERLAAALGRAGFTVSWGTREVPVGADDEMQLRRAVELGAVLVTGNSVDFARIHRDWSAQGLGHSGVVTIRRIPPRSPEALAEVLIALMREHTLGSFANSFHRV